MYYLLLYLGVVWYMLILRIWDMIFFGISMLIFGRINRREMILIDCMINMLIF